MVDHLPNLGREQEMLKEMGFTSMDELFSDIPDEVRRDEPLDLPPPQSEEEIWADATRLLGANVPMSARPSFIGAGLYHNYVPTMVPMLGTRGEFLTAYTPYQPEVSQGMLQAMWEFQTMVSELVALPISNVSMYDASTAAAEAITCAVRVHNRKASQKDVVYIVEHLPDYRSSVIHNYTQGGGIEIRVLPTDENGMVDLDAAAEAAGSCAVYVEQPSPLGVIDENLDSLKEVIGETTALIVGVNPVSLGILAPPGDWGADIVVGEGQAFGIGATAGGPVYGLFACSEKYLRQMPGRIVGKTFDEEGADAFTLTLSTREQHIRRHKATSNICSNETLIAMMGAMHMALLGPGGLEALAIRNMAVSMLVKEGLNSLDGVNLLYPDSSNFNEATYVLPASASNCLAHLDSLGVTGGLALSETTSGADEKWLHVTATDQVSASDVEAFIDGMASWLEVVG